ncbi:MAG: hypothetical protein JST31_03080 [Actinobacteria bacterium]|nr:hypothetical protein [Actinomycetota bacterium]
MTETAIATTRVERIEVPRSSRELTVLAAVDYEDAFLVAPAPAGSAVAAAVATLAEAPAELRQLLLAGWSALGLRLGAGVGRQVLGWRLRRGEDEVAVLAAASPLGIEAELVFARGPEALTYATFVRLRGERAGAAWAEIAPHHPPMVERLLRRAFS